MDIIKINKKYWSEKTIGEYCIVGDGAHASLKRLTAGIMYLTSKNLKDGGLDLSKVDYISEEDYKKYFREESKALSKPKTDDVLFSIIGTIGEPYLVKPKDKFGLSSSVSILRPEKTEIIAKYLYYWIRGHIFQNSLYAIKGGVAQSYVSLEMIRSLPLYYPPLPTQRKIASILSAYDDLIENNTRRIKILEDMAQSLYQEWFVKFRFPGYEQVKMVESALGLIPEGWEVVSFTDVVEILSGGTPKTKITEYWDGDIPFFTPKDTPEYFYVIQTEKTITKLGLKKCNSKLYPKNTVLITARGTVGKTVLAGVNMAMNQSCFALKAKDNFNQYFVFLAIRNYVEHLRKVASGATFDAIVTETFRRLLSTKPPFVLVEKFGNLAAPIFEQILNLINKNQNLRQTRDLLLPKLISGEIDVEKLNIDTTEIAA